MSEKDADVRHEDMICLWQIRLGDVDLTSVPAEHLVGGVVIKNVSGCDLVTILDNVKGMWVKIISQSLGSGQ